jgi:hypothetical protein
LQIHQNQILLKQVNPFIVAHSLPNFINFLCIPLFTFFQIHQIKNSKQTSPFTVVNTVVHSCELFFLYFKFYPGLCGVPNSRNETLHKQLPSQLLINSSAVFWRLFFFIPGAEFKSRGLLSQRGATFTSDLALGLWRRLELTTTFITRAALQVIV